MDFFYKSEIIAVCHVYVTQTGLKRPFHVTRQGSGNFVVVCKSQFYCGNEVKQRTQGRNKQIVDLIIY